MATLTVSAQDEKRVKSLGFLSNKGTDNFSGRIITTNGKITAAQNKCITEAAQLFGNGNITFTSRLTIEVQGIPYEKIDEFIAYIAKEGLETGGTGAKVRPIVSCKGTTCKFGLIDTFALSEEIHNRFYKGYRDVNLPHKFKIAVGGCPNSCVKPDLNDLGIVGQRKPNYNADKCKGCKKCSVEEVCTIGAAKVVDGKLTISNDCINCGLCVGKCHFGAIDGGTDGYKIYIGGRWGKKIAIGKPLSKMFFNKKDVLDIVEKSIILYKEQGEARERFAQTIERIGFDKVEKQLLSNELLDRKLEILDANK